MRKILRQDVVTLPKQSLTGLKVALGVRAQYVTLIALSMLMATQIIGVAIFSGKAKAYADVNYVRTIGTDNPYPWAFDDFDGRIAEDSSGVIYIASERPGNQILKYNSSGTYLGSVTLSVYLDGSPEGSSESYARGMAVDSSGGIYIASYGGLFKFGSNGALIDTIVSSADVKDVKVDSSGNIYYLRTSGDTGHLYKISSSYAAIGDWSISGYAESVNDLALAPSGVVYLSSVDCLSGYNRCIAKVDTVGSVVSTFADNGADSRPGRIAVDSSGFIYAINAQQSDANPYSLSNINRIQKLNPDGTIAANLGSTGDDLGKLNFRSHGSYPNGNDLFISSTDTLYVGDSGNSRVQLLATDGTPVDEWRDTFANPTGMAIGASGAMYVIDHDNNRIQKLNKSTGEVLATWGGAGSATGKFNFDKTDYTDAQTGNAIAVDSGENVYITDTGNNRVQKFTSSGVFVLEWGLTGSADDLLSSPAGIAIDSNDVVYVLDIGHNKVKKFTTGGAYSGLVAPGYTPSWQSLKGFISVDNADNVYINDNNTIHIYASGVTHESTTINNTDAFGVYSHGSMMREDSSGGSSNRCSYTTWTPTTTIACPEPQGGYSNPITAIAADSQGNYYTTDDQNRIIQFHVDTGDINATTKPATSVAQTSATINGVAGLPAGSSTRGFQYGLTTAYGSSAQYAGALDQYGYADSFGSYGSGDGELSSPVEIAHDGVGNLYVSDYLNHRVQKFSPNGDYLLQFGSQGSGNGQFSFPRGIAVDSSGFVFVADYSNNRVQKFDANGNYITKWGSQVDTAGGNGNFFGTNKIAVDSADNIYVTDVGSAHVVQKFTNNGVFIEQFGGTGSSDGEFASIGGITIDQNDVVYVADAGNDRIQKFDTDGNFESVWGTSGSAAGEINQPLDIEADFNGDIVVLDYGNTRIQKFTADGVLRMYSVYASGVGALNNAQGITTDASGNVYVANSMSHSILKYGASISKQLSGLTCGTTYHYRAYATDTTGTAYGADEEFTTTGCSSSFSIITTVLNGGAVGDYTFQSIQTENASEAPVFSLVSGNFPVGPSFDSNGNLVGSFIEAGTYTFTIQAQSGSETATKEYTIVVTEATAPCNLQVTATNTNAQVGTNYSAQVETTGASGSPTFDVYSGSFPDGISMDTNGAISGTPDLSTADNYYEAVVRAQDGDCSAYGYINIYVEQVSSIQIYGTSLNAGRVGQEYSNGALPSYVYGGLGPHTYQIASGSLPNGLSLNAMDGSITGTPTAAGTYTFNVEVSDITGSSSAEFSIVVNPAAASTENAAIVTITSPSNNTTFDYKHDTVVVTGTGPKNKTITTYMDGQELGTALVNSSGNWTYTVNNVFPGNHSFDAKWTPQGDVALVTGFPTEGATTFRMDARLYDTSTNELIHAIHLPENFYSISTIFNRVGDKAYIVGANAANMVSEVYEIDMTTGLPTRMMSNDAIPGWVAYSGLLSADEHYIYSLLTPTDEDYVGTFMIVKLDLSTGSYVADPVVINEQNYGLDPDTHWQDLMFTFTDLEGTGPMVYTPLTEDPSELVATASRINMETGAVESFTLHPTDVYSLASAHTTASDGNVYFASWTYGGGDHYYMNVAQVNNGENSVAYTHAVEPPSGLDLHGDEWGAVTMPLAMTVNADTNKAYIVTKDYLYTLDLQTGSRTYKALDVPLDNVDHSIRLANNGSKLYITNADNDDNSTFIIFDTATEQFTNVVLGESYFGGSGSFIGGRAAASARVNFSIGLAPELPPTDEPPTTGDPTPDPPTITDVTPPPSTPTRAPAKTSPISAPQKTIATQNSLLALAKRIPEPFAIGFPWILLILALVLVSVQYYQVHSEAALTKRMQTSVANQERLVDEQNNFVALSTHYLHTPLTVMEGEISLMVKAGTLSQDQANKLQATLASLNAEAEAVLAQEEQNEVE